MARYSQKPESALKRANEFIEVGKPNCALDTLYEIFRYKTLAFNCNETILEPIIMKYLTLCVELKKSHIAKEGLFQYRNMFMLVNLASLEYVVFGYLTMAEEKAESARQLAQNKEIDVEDLDVLVTPENILLRSVSGEDAQNRNDRTILTPSVKFLWESYCHCIELLKFNVHLEKMYHEIVRMAFTFCMKYNRKTEFRKLCDKLRKHLDDMTKLSPQGQNVSLYKSETQDINLATRIIQLDTAIQMDLWQEAYKAIVDINGLITLSKKIPGSKTMANYYQKLAMVFWKAENALFHAAALVKYFEILRNMRKHVSLEDVQPLACQLLLAILAIPHPTSYSDFDCLTETEHNTLLKAHKLSILLGLSQPPSRQTLFSDLDRLNILNLVPQLYQNLYKLIVLEFSPLCLCSKVCNLIEELKSDLKSPIHQYEGKIKDITTLRFIRQISLVYQKIEYSHLINLACYSTPFELERKVVTCAHSYGMQIHIDHSNQCIQFGSSLFGKQTEFVDETNMQSNHSSSNILVNIARILIKCVGVLSAKPRELNINNLRKMLIDNYEQTKEITHKHMLERSKIIEKRKEYIEKLNIAREEEEARQMEEFARQQAFALQQKLEQEREERERRRQELEMQRIRDRTLLQKVKQISQTAHGQKILKKLHGECTEKLDVEQLAACEAEELLRERREFCQKLKSQEKKLDHLERAKRIYELPILQEFLKSKQLEDEEQWMKSENTRIEHLIAERTSLIKERVRLNRMSADKEKFSSALRAKRRSAYQNLLKDYHRLYNQVRKERIGTRKLARRDERKAKWLKETSEKRVQLSDSESEQQCTSSNVSVEEERKDNIHDSSLEARDQSKTNDMNWRREESQQRFWRQTEYHSQNTIPPTWHQGRSNQPSQRSDIQNEWRKSTDHQDGKQRVPYHSLENRQDWLRGSKFPGREQEFLRCSIPQSSEGRSEWRRPAIRDPGNQKRISWRSRRTQDSSDRSSSTYSNYSDKSE